MATTQDFACSEDNAFMNSIGHDMPHSPSLVFVRLIKLSLALFAIIVCASHLAAQDNVPPPLLTKDYYGSSTPEASQSGIQPFYGSQFESGNIAWMMASCVSSLFLLTPGLLLFYCGLLRIRGVWTVMIRYVGVVALLSMAWVLWIYTLGFSRNSDSADVLESERNLVATERNQLNRLFGEASHLGFRGMDSQLEGNVPVYPLRRPSEKIPHLLFMMCQLAFFVSVPAPLLVALHGRLTWSVLTVGAVLWGTIVYSPIVYWVWGGGSQDAVLDAAGALPAHISIGATSLILAAFAGCRKQLTEPAETPRRVACLAVGTVLFWSGSMIWNSSRSVSIDGSAMNSFVVTYFASCGGLIGWCGIDWLIRGRLRLSSLCIGPFVGLISVASGCRYIAPQSAILVGLLSGFVTCIVFTQTTKRFPGNTMAIVCVLHATGGWLGTILAGVFATASVAGMDQSGNPIGGLIEGDFNRAVSQAFAAGSAVAVAVTGTFAIVLLFKLAGISRPKITPGSTKDYS